MPSERLPIYSRDEGRAYLEVVRLQEGSKLRVQKRRRSTQPQLPSYWVMWLRHRLLDSGAPVSVGIVRSDRSLEVSSSIDPERLTNTVRSIGSEVRPLRRLPMRRDTGQATSNEQRWEFAPDHGITPELMGSVVHRLNSELPKGVTVTGESWGGSDRSDVHLTLSRPPSHRPAALTMAQLGKWVEWRMAEALTAARV